MAKSKRIKYPNCYGKIKGFIPACSAPPPMTKKEMRKELNRRLSDYVKMKLISKIGKAFMLEQFEAGSKLHFDVGYIIPEHFGELPHTRLDIKIGIKYNHEKLK